MQGPPKSRSLCSEKTSKLVSSPLHHVSLVSAGLDSLDQNRTPVKPPINLQTLAPLELKTQYCFNSNFSQSDHLRMQSKQRSFSSTIRKQQTIFNHCKLALLV